MPLPEVEKSVRVEKERQKPLFVELSDTKLPQVDLLIGAVLLPGAKAPKLIRRDMRWKRATRERARQESEVEGVAHERRRPDR